MIDCFVCYLQSGDVVYLDWKLSKDSDSGKIIGKFNYYLQVKICLLFAKFIYETFVKNVFEYHACLFSSKN